MKTRLRGLRWAVLGALASALVLASAAGANHAGPFNIGHFNTTLPGEVNGLTCSGTTSPCLEAVNATVTTVSPPTIALRGRHSATTGRGVGVFGATASTDNVISQGVRGDAVAGSGVLGQSTNGAGVLGLHNATTGTSPGVLGSTNSTATAAAGVYGFADGAGSDVMGVLGTSANGMGVAASGGGIGLFATSPNLAGYFNGPVLVQGNQAVLGDLFVQGTLTKGAGAFRIDHPLDRSKYLQHSFVESPDMMNVYNGNVRTDRRGFATVRLPRYFSALNRDFRYQLTIVGTRGWRARVVEKIRGNSFRIQTDAPRAQVSWQVTGIRKDRYANAHRIQPEIAKSSVEPAALRPGQLNRLRARVKR